VSLTPTDLLRPASTLLALAAVAALAGCATLPPSGASPLVAPDTSGSSPSAVPESTPTPAQGIAPAEGGASTSTAPDRCRTDDLEGTVDDDGLSVGGDAQVTLVLTNAGSTSCTLQGWPGVSLVGLGDGTQLGAAAERDIVSLPHDTVTLQAGGAATVLVLVAPAVDWAAAQCRPRLSDGFRVYPPGETHALFVEGEYTACADPTVSLLTVNAVQPG